MRATKNDKAVYSSKCPLFLINIFSLYEFTDTLFSFPLLAEGFLIASVPLKAGGTLLLLSMLSFMEFVIESLRTLDSSPVLDAFQIIKATIAKEIKNKIVVLISLFLFMIDYLLLKNLLEKEEILILNFLNGMNEFKKTVILYMKILFAGFPFLYIRLTTASS